MKFYTLIFDQLSAQNCITHRQTGIFQKPSIHFLILNAYENILHNSLMENKHLFHYIISAHLSAEL